MQVSIETKIIVTVFWMNYRLEGEEIMFSIKSNLKIYNIHIFQDRIFINATEATTKSILLVYGLCIVQFGLLFLLNCL